MIQADPYPVGPVRMILGLVAFGTLQFAVALFSMELSSQAQGVSPIWFTNAVAVSLLLWRPPVDLRIGLLVNLLALVPANLSTGSAPGPAFAMAAINTAEIAGIILGARALIGRGPPLINLVRFAALAVAGAGLSALAAALALSVLNDADPAVVLRVWFLSDLLGLLIIVPPAIGVTREDLGRLKQPVHALTALACAGLAGAVTLAVFSQQPYPILFTVLPALILATYLLGHVGAALGNIVVVLIAAGMTASGHGPIAFRVVDPYAQSLLLQAFLALNAGVIFPLAAIVAQRTQLVASLRDREERARQVTELAPMAILRVGADGAIVEANPGVFELTGRGPDTLVGAPFRYLVTADASTSLLDWSTVPVSGSIRTDLPITVAGGGSRYAEFAATPQIGPGGCVASWIVVLTDIDERRQEQLRLQANERLQQLLAENSHDMVVRISIDGVRLYASPACERLLGYTQAEMVGATPIAAIHPDDRARVTDVARTLLSGVPDPTCTYRQRHRDGRWVWLEAVYRLIRDPETGAPTEFIASVRDVSRRQAAELQAAQAASQLHERNRLLTLAEGLAGVGHYSLDLIGNELFWSAEVYAIYGLPSETRPSLDTAIEAYHPDDRERVGRLIGDAIDTAQPFSFQARLVRPDGEIRWVQASGQTEAAPSGQVVSLFGVFQDVTAQVENERTLIKARQDAEEALAAKSLFTATMSHEIRTPLTGVLAAAELLGDGDTPEERRRCLSALRQSGKLLSSIIDDVLVFSKLDEGQVELEREEFDLGELVGDVVTAFQASATEKNLSLRYLQPVARERVLGDPVRIQRVLANLVSNAIKFTPQGHVTVSLEREPGSEESWRFDVVDTGPGVPAASRDRIFKPYAQADAGVARRHGGTGLGLAICRHLVEAMGGTIRVADQDAAGARFSFVLPLSPVHDRSDAAGRSDEAEEGLPRLDVLVAEDNQVNRYLIEKLLERLGQTVTVVEDGAQALAAVETRAGRPFDLVFMDIQMPVMDGEEASRAIRALAGPAASTPICAVTAEDSHQRRHLLQGAGIDDVIAKPIRRESLIRLLRAFGGAPAVAGDTTGTMHHLAARNALPAIDHVRLRSLEAALGRVGRDRLLELLITDAVDRPQVMRRALENSRPDQVALGAHALKGAAAIVGAERLVAVLRSAIEEAREGTLGMRTLSAVEKEAAAVAREGRALVQAAAA